MLVGLASTVFIRAMLRAGGRVRRRHRHPLPGAWGVWGAGAMLVAVALMWLVPDRRIERVLEREQPA